VLTKNIIIVTLFCFSLFAEKAQMRTYKPSVSLRVETEAKNAQSFQASRGSSVIDFILPDGSKVTAGDTVVRFNSERVKHHYDQKVNIKNSSEITYKNNIFDINNNIKDLKNEIKDHKEAILTQKVTLNAILNLPKKEDVKLAKSNLRVAQVDFDAAKEELEKATVRYEKNYISSVEYAKLELTYKLKENSLLQQKELLAVTERKADPRDIKKAQIKLKNLELQYEFSSKSLDDSIKIAESKIKKQEKYLEKLDRDIEKYSERLENTVNKAEVDGYVKYSDISTPIEAGSIIYWGQTIASIPDLTSTYFTAFLPENKIKHFKAGSPGTIQISGRLDELLEVKISKISATPEDIAYQAKVGWGKTVKTTGVKFYKLTVKSKQLPSWLRPGMTGILSLQAEAESRLSLPASFIHHKENKTYIAFNDQMNQVDGESQGEFFFFTKPDDYRETNFQRSAPWPKKEDTLNEEFTGDSLILSGEMTAVQENLVVVPFLSDKTTISWLIPEESRVEIGDVLARLDATELDETILKSETTLADREEGLETAETRLQKTKDEFSFDQRRLENSLEAARLSKDIIIKPLISKTLITKRFSWKSLKLQLDHEKFLYDRLKAKPSHLISSAEMAKAKLAYEEAELKLQKAKIALDEEEKGATTAELAKAEIDFELAKDSIDKVIQRMPIDIEEVKNSLITAEILLANQQTSLKNLKSEYNSLVIKATTKGTVHYKKLWTMNGTKKVEVGSEVRSWKRILALPETEFMTVKVKVLEKFFPMIQDDVIVKISIPSIEGKTFTGKLGSPGFNFDQEDEIEQSTDPYSSREPSGKVFAIYEIQLPSLAKYKIKPGSIAQVEIPLSLIQ
jgi:multidrug resistance efflux pump